MLEFSQLKEMTLNEIFSLNDEYKRKAIYLLIEQIAEDRVFDAISHFKTDEEAKKFKEYIDK